MSTTSLTRRLTLAGSVGLLTACGGGASAGGTLAGNKLDLPLLPGEMAAGGGGVVGTASGAAPGSATGAVATGTSATATGVAAFTEASSAAGSGGDDFTTCAGETQTTELLPPVLELLVDTSLSMTEMAPGSTVSKWEETRDALLTAIDALPEDVSVGLTFYPDVAAPMGGGGFGGGGMQMQMCFDSQADVPITLLGAVGSAQRTALADALNAQVPDGYTPTHDAYVYALSELAAGPADANKFVVLITDGVPTFSRNCVGPDTMGVDPTPIITEATSALTTGVKSFVIGSPGSEDARSSLSEIASEGGTGQPACANAGPNYCHFDMTSEPDFAVALTQALANITEQVLLSCTYKIPPPPGGELLDKERVNVTLTVPGGEPQQIGKDPSETECNVGWQYGPSGDEILLCGTTCTAVEQSQGTIALEFGCTTTIQ